MYVFWSWNTVQKSILFFYLSICTHYSCFENMGQFVTLKKIRSKIWVAKSRVQKTGSLLFKKRKICRWNQPCEKASVWKWGFSIRNYFTRLCTPAEKYCMCPSKDAKCKKIAPIHYYKRTYVCHSSRSLTTFEICIRYCLSDNSVMPDLRLLKYIGYSMPVWQYGLWSFQTGGTKLERFLPKIFA